MFNARISGTLNLKPRKTTQSSQLGWLEAAIASLRSGWARALLHWKEVPDGYGKLRVSIRHEVAACGKNALLQPLPYILSFTLQGLIAGVVPAADNHAALAQSRRRIFLWF